MIRTGQSWEAEQPRCNGDARYANTEPCTHGAICCAAVWPGSCSSAGHTTTSLSLMPDWVPAAAPLLLLIMWPPAKDCWGKPYPSVWVSADPNENIWLLEGGEGIKENNRSGNNSGERKG